MFIRDYFNVVNTGERLYSVILDEDELRMFNEISSEENNQSSDKKKKLLKGAAIAGSALIGNKIGYDAAGHILRKKINKLAYGNGFKIDFGNGGHINPVDPRDEKKLQKLLKISTPAQYTAGALGAAALGYGAYKLMKHRDKKKNNN